MLYLPLHEDQCSYLLQLCFLVSSLSEAFERAAEKKESGDKKQAAKKTTIKKKDVRMYTVLN